MRTLLCALALTLVLAVAAPPAAAQVASTSTLALQLNSPSAPVPPGTPIDLKGEISYHSDALAPLLQPQGVRVTLSVVKAPEWAAVRVTPEQIVLQPGAAVGSPSSHAQSLFRVIVIVADGAPEGAPADLVVEARSDGGTLVASSSATATALLTAGSTEPCHHPEEGAPADELTTQSAAAAAPAAATLGAWAAGGLGLAGGVGAGLLLRRRLRG